VSHTRYDRRIRATVAGLALVAVSEGRTDYPKTPRSVQLDTKEIVE